MGVNSLNKTVTRQRHGCDLNSGPTVPESSMLTTWIPSHSTVAHSKPCLKRNVICKAKLQSLSRCNSHAAYASKYDTGTGVGKVLQSDSWHRGGVFSVRRQLLIESR